MVPAVFVEKSISRIILGIVETPYRVVKNGKVTGEITWLDANREEDALIAQASSRTDDHGNFLEELVLARQQGDVYEAWREYRQANTRAKRA